MNIFKNLIGRVWQDANAAELVKISTGQLYLVRPGNIRTSRECIYNDAMATIRRVPSLEHNFQLVVTRVYEEGNQELLEDEDETDEERVFLVGEELDFRTGQTEGEPTFVWRDMEGGVDEFFEFVAIGTNAVTQAFFETCMYRAMYERKYKTSADHLTDADLQEFTYEPPQQKKHKPKQSPPRKKVSDPDAATSITSKMQSLSVSSGPSSSQTSATVSSVDTTTSPFDSYPTLVDEVAELHLWDRKKGYFVKQTDGRATIVGSPTNSKSNGYEYWIIARSTEGDDGGRVVLWHKVDPDMNQRWSTKVWSLTWNHMNEKGIQTSWCFRFLAQGSYAVFQEQFTRALWETLHQVPWSTSKPDEQAYALRSNEDVEMSDVEDDEVEEDAVLDELDAEDSEEEVRGEEDDELPEALKTGEKNSQLAVGFKGDRSYVVRGGNIGVFRHSRDQDQVKYYATIGNIATPKGKKFNPKKVMLHDSDNRMILFDDAAPNSLFALDIERGKVVEEWKVDEYVPVNNIAPKDKYAQTTGEQTVVGISGNALYRIDPRLSGNKMVQNEMKQYTTKTKFSAVTTTGSGKLAVAGDKGDIRLFDSIGKNAKTALPALGDPILGIDVSGDGRWVVATTKTYLLLIDAMIGDGRYAGSLGFDRAFPADAKPIPRRLQLRAEHVAYMGHSVAFTPARFNMGENQEENAIVTSTGEYVVAWDFNKVKKGYLDKYHIKKYEDQVVQDNFKFGDDKEIIVALQNNVLALNKKQLKRPTRASLAPGHSIPGHSDIVNSPW